MKNSKLILVFALLIIAQADDFKSIGEYWNEAKDKVKDYLEDSKPIQKVKDIYQEGKEKFEDKKEKVEDKYNEIEDKIDDKVWNVSDKVEKIKDNPKLKKSLHSLKENGYEMTKENTKRIIKGDFNKMEAEAKKLDGPKYFGPDYTGISKEDYEKAWDYIKNKSGSFATKLKEFKMRVAYLKAEKAIPKPEDDFKVIQSDVVDHEDAQYKNMAKTGGRRLESEKRFLENSDFSQIIKPNPIP